MLSQKRRTQFSKQEASWTVNIEKWWRKAAGYSRLNGASSPPLTRCNSEIQTIKKLDNERTSQRVKPTTRKPSTARPVVVVERTRELQPPKWRSNNRSVNINEEFIEVFYWTQSRYNYPGQLERYRKNLCYCCADCPACQNEANSTIVDRHRPLSQARSPREPVPSLYTEPPRYYHGCNGNLLRTSYT